MFLGTNENANNEAQTIDVTVQVIEPLGSTMDLFCDTKSDQHLTARIKARALQVQTQARLYVDMEQVHLFEPGDYGENLTLDAS